MGLRGVFASIACVFGLLVCAPSWSEPPDITEYLVKLENLLEISEAEPYIELLEELEKTPTIELHQMVIKKLESLLSILDPDVEETIEITRIISASLESLRKLGTADDAEFLSELSHWASMTLRLADVETEILNAALEIKSVNSRQLVSIMKIGKNTSVAVAHRAESAGRRNFELVVRKAQNLIEFMRARVIEQDEALEMLQALYLKDLLTAGQRSKPEVFYMMGLPGVGKDTIAKAFVDAQWDKPGAYKEHMFRMNIKTREEGWSYFGSAKGYIGSTDLPAFLRFLVQHSGGKYLLAQVKDVRGNDQLIIEKNPEWDGVYRGTTPDKALVFINEFHNVPRVVKDDLLKEAVGDGIFPINNPGSTPNSVDHLELPVTFAIASNEGISLIEPREKNGARIGQPLSFEALMENHSKVHDDPERLKQAQIDHYGEKNDRVLPGDPGVSEEFQSRVPNSRLILLRPISPEGLKKIVRLFEKEMTSALKDTNAFLQPFDLSLSGELVDFISSYKAVPSEGARPLEDRLKSLVFDPFFKAIVTGKIRPTGKKLAIQIGLQGYQNQVQSLTFKVFEGVSLDQITDEQPTYQFTRIIKPTLSDLPQQALTNEEIQRFLALREEITSNVFGTDHIVDRLVEAVIASESESRNTGASRGATVMAFLGKTSTGKSELAKQYTLARHGRDQQPTVLDFNGIRDLQSVKAKILGTHDIRNNPIASDFMKAYDHANGHLTFIFDEAANAPKELLKALYEILREPIVTGFSDGKPRPMMNVTIILTGNAGEEIYQNIPTDLSTRRFAQAMTEVFQIFIKNEALQNKILTNTFPEALLARLGRNIFHFGPHTNKSKRQLAQLKLMQGLRRLAPKPSERGWYIEFASEQDLYKVFHMIEVEGYNQAYQGASIDKFVREALIDAIKVKLLASGIQDKSTVVLRIGDLVEPTNSDSPPFRRLFLTSQDGRELEVIVPLQRLVNELPQSIEQRLLVAFHEVGHEIVSHYYFHELIEPTELKILPGVTIIDEELVVFEGVRGGRQMQKVSPDRGYILRRAAVLAGGYIGEQLVTLGHRHGAGKANDIKRATDLIHNAILRWGLSEEWDKQAIPANLSVADYISKHLSDREKESLHTLTKAWLSEAERMAVLAIVSNLNGAFYSLSKAVAEKGDLSGEEIKQIYSAEKIVFNANESSTPEFDPVAVYGQLESLLSKGNTDQGTLFSAREVRQDPNFYERTFNRLSSNSVGWVQRNLGRAKKWHQLSPTEQMMAQIIISRMVEDKSLQPQLVNEIWHFESVVNPEEILEAREEQQRQGVIDLEKYRLRQGEAHRSVDENSRTVEAVKSQPEGSPLCLSLIKGA